MERSSLRQFLTKVSIDIPLVLIDTVSGLHLVRCESQMQPESIYTRHVHYPRKRRSKQEIHAAKCTAIMVKILHSLPKDASETSSAPLNKYVKQLVDIGISSDEALLLIRDISAIMLPKVRKEKAQRVDIAEYICTITPAQTTKKLPDPSSFILDCSISTGRLSRSLCDLGSIINLMPKSVAERLGMTNYGPTRITLLFADRSNRIPEGILEDVPIKVGNSFILADFVVLDYEKEPKDPLILGRAFLATAGAQNPIIEPHTTLPSAHNDSCRATVSINTTTPVDRHPRDSQTEDSAQSFQPTPLEYLCDKFSSNLPSINSLDSLKSASQDNKPRVLRKLVSPFVLAGDEKSVDRHTTKCRSTPSAASTRSVYSPPWKARRQE